MGIRNSAVSLALTIVQENLYRHLVIRRQGEMFPLRIDTVEAVETLL